MGTLAAATALQVLCKGLYHLAINVARLDIICKFAVFLGVFQEILKPPKSQFHVSFVFLGVTINV